MGEGGEGRAEAREGGLLDRRACRPAQKAPPPRVFSEILAHLPCGCGSATILLLILLLLLLGAVGAVLREGGIREESATCFAELRD